MALIENSISLFLSGDVMLGRAIDQIMPFPLSPRIHEDYLLSAVDYVRLAEKKNGPIPRPVSYEYIWGAALDELQKANPDIRLINLETAVTTNSRWEPKGINYRMHPYNVPVLATAQIDVAVLANNHVLDWKDKGLLQTLETLKSNSIRTVGAGVNSFEAAMPATIRLRRGRAVVSIFAWAHPSSGVPLEWAAGNEKPGIQILPDFSSASFERLRSTIQRHSEPSDLKILSLHWGDNWGYEISKPEIDFARKCIDENLVDVIHGHSSHHPKAIEVFQGKPILYGCGDFINDYEGISGYEEFRADLVLMYFLKIDGKTRKLAELRMVPLRLKNFRLERPSREDIEWLFQILNREEKKFGNSIVMGPDQRSFFLVH